MVCLYPALPQKSINRTYKNESKAKDHELKLVAEKCTPQWPEHFPWEILKFDSKVSKNQSEEKNLISQVRHLEE